MFIIDLLFIFQISPHGYVALDKKTVADLVPFFFLNNWPNPNYPSSKDPPFIAPFYSEADFRVGRGDPAKMYYRILDVTQAPTDSQRKIQEGMLNHFTELVRDAIVGADHFIAKFGIVITWYKVTFGSSSCSSSPEDNCRVKIKVALIIFL
jgi:hypothetical protein